ncbi:6-phosphogluconolactonase [Sorangium cellulosum]|uniref:6-phosphogluconolactonase n=1 Tax=Sorangium cellulosum TaxID=56 RepID=A0A2L0EXB5_SORCE|nr:6-phosphogluconolactonase [Sorangium cellulosum]AUX43926.1 6-phosphogluconolactonase [Sorangium cellulosum]
MSSGAEETCVAKDAAEMSRLAAELAARAIAAAIEARGVARIALSGGGTPSEAYQRLAALDLPWAQTEWFWVDERAVAPDHPRSNYGAARRDLAAAHIPEENFFRMEGESPDLAGAAARYEQVLRARFGVAAAAAFDVMTMGIGDDAHTASLFPGTGAVHIEDRLVAAIPAQPDKGLEARLTLTAPVIREARLKLLLARGASKRAVIEQAKRPGPADEVPARIVRGGTGRLVWLLDAAAAGAG